MVQTSTSLANGVRDEPPTPDFDCYPCTVAARDARVEGDLVRIEWDDGVVSRFHLLWLRDNAADEDTLNPVTREQTLDISTLPAELHAASARIDPTGALAVHWLPEDRTVRYHQGWLRAFDYSNDALEWGRLPDAEPWTPASLPAPLDFDGPGFLERDEVLGEALGAVLAHGIARLRGVPTEPGTVGRVARRIGPIRETNFGLLFDVRAKPDADSNAYTTLELLPHTDLPTREYEPGLQLLHCLENTARGGRAVMVDGLAVAGDIRREAPEHWHALTTIAWNFSNRARDTDYRFRSPIIVLDDRGEVAELRVNNFLRAPLSAPFDVVEAAYAGLLELQSRLRDERYRMTFDYRPGDLVVFDNRRVLHGREAFDQSGGARWLQGCYLERDELRSRWRVLARARRRETLRQS
ncbi:MAG: TauD/TfdA family dioxygenase [Gammaproteobacteria bacterium]|nr:TauD/TfdA family dioxygenase [Gammaproteobacteria bacterium]